jgi:hypothetical protein
MGILHSDPSSATVEGTLDDPVNISRKAFTAVLPIRCTTIALLFLPDTDTTFHVGENTNMHIYSSPVVNLSVTVLNINMLNKRLLLALEQLFKPETILFKG